MSRLAQAPGAQLAARGSGRRRGGDCERACRRARAWEAAEGAAEATKHRLQIVRALNPRCGCNVYYGCNCLFLSVSGDYYIARWEHVPLLLCLAVVQKFSSSPPLRRKPAVAKAGSSFERRVGGCDEETCGC